MAQARTKGTGPVSVANHNTETQIVITGSPAAVKEVADQVAANMGGRAIPLKVSGAWHSELIQGAEKEVRGSSRKASLSTRPRTPVIHNVSPAETEADPEKIRSLMARQLCSPVRWLARSRATPVDKETRCLVGPGRGGS